MFLHIVAYLDHLFTEFAQKCLCLPNSASRQSHEVKDILHISCAFYIAFVLLLETYKYDKSIAYFCI